MNKVILPHPSIEQVNHYLSIWNSNYKTLMQESSLKLLFEHTYPLNNNVDEILIKVAALDKIFSTNINNPYRVAQHILELDIDKRLKEKDMSLVNVLAKVKFEHKEMNLYSFASKYCSHHYPNDYPIYDSYVLKVLKSFNDSYSFIEVKLNEEYLKDYKNFKNTLIKFSQFFKLEEFNLKELDKYLWLLGKEKFTKKY